ncbi:MAG: hypothetical protein KDA76_15320 [Planctomycetaceae bacterium]|nr:hypothetical protein [Planctomycetaceae bacterium]
MKLQDIAIADGKIESVRTSITEAEINFVDWREAKWSFTFVDVLAVENLNVEGEELDRLEVRKDDPYIERVRAIVDEPNATVNVYLFFTPWKDEPRLRVVAKDCNVNSAKEEFPSPSP